MEEESVIKLDETAIKTLKGIFAGRISIESQGTTLENFSKALQIKELEGKIISFARTNPISNFEINFFGETTKKKITVKISNFSGDEIEGNDIVINVLDTWTEAEVYFAATLGKSKPITVLRAK
jgi:hypothetical protein